LDVMLAKRKMKSNELAHRIGITGERQRRADVVCIARVAIQHCHQRSVPSAVRSC